VLWAVWTPAVCPALPVWRGVERTGCRSGGMPAGGGRRWCTGPRCTAGPSYPQSCPQVWVDPGSVSNRPVSGWCSTVSTSPQPKRLRRLSSSHTRRRARRSRVSTSSRASGSLRVRVGAIQSVVSRWRIASASRSPPACAHPGGCRSAGRSGGPLKLHPVGLPGQVGHRAAQRGGQVVDQSAPVEPALSEFRHRQVALGNPRQLGHHPQAHPTASADHPSARTDRSRILSVHENPLLPDVLGGCPGR
jgi:hypothetical protein